jgi:hypothetical protein
VLATTVTCHSHRPYRAQLAQHCQMLTEAECLNRYRLFLLILCREPFSPTSICKASLFTCSRVVHQPRRGLDLCNAFVAGDSWLVGPAFAHPRLEAPLQHPAIAACAPLTIVLFSKRHHGLSSPRRSFSCLTLHTQGVLLSNPFLPELSTPPGPRPPSIQFERCLTRPLPHRADARSYVHGISPPSPCVPLTIQTHFLASHVYPAPPPPIGTAQ